jgi:hypothetical protein
LLFGFVISQLSCRKIWLLHLNWLVSVITIEEFALSWLICHVGRFISIVYCIYTYWCHVGNEQKFQSLETSWLMFNGQILENRQFWLDDCIEKYRLDQNQQLQRN